MRDALHLLALSALACLCAHGLLRAAEAEAVAGRARAEAMRAVEAANLAADEVWAVNARRDVSCRCEWALEHRGDMAVLRDKVAVRCRPGCDVRWAFDAPETLWP